MTRIEQIRQREQVTGWGTFGELHADVTALLSAWDTRDAALRTLVERLMEVTADEEAWLEARPVRGDLADRAYRSALLARGRYIQKALDAILKETTP